MAVKIGAADILTGKTVMAVCPVQPGHAGTVTGPDLAPQSRRTANGGKITGITLDGIHDGQCDTRLRDTADLAGRVIGIARIISAQQGIDSIVAVREKIPLGA